MLIRHVHCALENRRSVELHFESGELHSNLVGAVQCIPWKFHVERPVWTPHGGFPFGEITFSSGERRERVILCPFGCRTSALPASERSSRAVHQGIFGAILI